MKGLGGRLFLAVELDESLRGAILRQLADRFHGQALPGRRVAPDRWHWTLRFLGQADAASARRLEQALAGSDLGPAFDLELGVLGAFPRPERARVLWLGCARGGDDLAGLAERIEERVVTLGFAREARPFSAHLTLSRLRPPVDLTGRLTESSPLQGGMRVETVTLMRSHLSSQGPRYEPLDRWALRESESTMPADDDPMRYHPDRSLQGG